MKQIYLKSLLFALMMLVGMEAWAAADYTLTPSAGSNNSYSNNCDVTIDGITWNVTGNAQMTPWRIGGKSLTKENREVYSKTAYPSALTKVSLEIGAATSIDINSIKLVYSTSSDFSNATTITITQSNIEANKTYDFTPAEGFPANSYYKFIFNVTVSGTSNKFLEFKKAEFYAVAGSTTLEPVDASWSVAPASVSVKATKTTTASISTNYDGTLSVASSNPEIATASINDKVITVTGVAEGSTTLTVTGAATSTYNAISKTIDVIVISNERPANAIFYESFNTNDGTGGNDGKWNGSIATNDIKQENDGWVFVNGSGANKCVKLGAGSRLGTATTPALGYAGNATLNFDVAAWDGSSENTTLKLSVIGGGTISPATVTMQKGAWRSFSATLTDLTKDSKIKFEGNAANNSRFFLDEVSVVAVAPAPYSLTISSSTGYATFYDSKNAYVMPDDCEGYVFTVDKGLERAYEAEEVVPAGEPLVIYTIEPGKKELVYTTSTEDTYKSGDMNDLEGTDEETALEADANSYFYALSLDKDGKKVGFYWMKEEGAAFTNGAHKAYLKAAKTTTSAKSFIFSDATAIKAIATATDAAKIYDLTGREVKSPKAGIYIVNGTKKYIK